MKRMEVVSIVTKNEVDVTDFVNDGVKVSKHDQLFQANTNKITSVSKVSSNK